MQCVDRDRPTPCIDYHIKQCLAPCIGTVTPEEYRSQAIDGVIDFLSGKYADIEKRLTEEMRVAATEKKFERAAELRDQLARIHALQERQIVSDTSGDDADIIGTAVLSGRAHVVLLQQRGGKLVGEESFALQGHSESIAEVLGQFLPQYYTESADIPASIIVGEEPDDRDSIEEWLKDLKGKRVRLIVPERGQKSRLLLLAEENAQNKARLTEAKWESEGRKLSEALEELARVLSLPSPPKRIEGYDISHLGGTETVGSMVVFENGKPRRPDYRSFNIRSVARGNVDDYQSLREVLKRRLKYLVEDVKREERQWEEQGITIRKAHKDEQGRIEAILREHPEELSSADVDYREFLVAVHESEIVAMGRMHEHQGGLLELKSLWVDESYRGGRLGSFLAHRLLKRIPKGKVYAAIRSELEAYYGDLGFRHVITPPQVLADAIAAETCSAGMVVMYEAKDHKRDESFAARPDLILVDGGKGQLATAVQILREYALEIPVAGLAKREEEIFVPGRASPVPVGKDSSARFLLQRLRDEAHRFANYKRKGRGKRTMLASALDDVPGIGPETRIALLKRFGSVDGVRFATDEELREVLSEEQVRGVRERLS